MPHFPLTEEAVATGTDTDTSSSLINKTESDEARANRLKIKTRRRRYLEMHPEYYESPGLELADPLLYDRSIRQFQTTAERQADGKQKGYSGKLEADLMRSEAKVEAIAHPDPDSPLIYRRDGEGSIVAVEQDEADRPKTKEEGAHRWRESMENRFLRGNDPDFDYETVDQNDMYDDWAEDTRRRQEDYFDKQEEEYVGDKGELEGETGIQDF